MATLRVEPGFDRDRNLAPQAVSSRLAPDLSRVLVVGQSQINRVVVSKIVERSGLRPVSETPESAVRVLPLVFPGLVILDGGSENRDCEALISGIAALRRISGKPLPAVILLSNRNGNPQTLSLTECIDAVVTKPFTTEQLQPVIDRVIETARRLEAGKA